MEIEEVKTWQWMLAGLVVGFLFSVIVAWSGPTFDTQARDTVEQGEFENGTFALSKFGQINNLSRQYHPDQPMLRDVTVHPPIASDPEHRCWVTGRSYFVGLKPTDPTKVGGAQKVYEEWRPFKYPASVPYTPGYTLREEKKLSRTTTVAQRARNQELAELKKSLGGQDKFATVNDYLKAVAALPGNGSFKYQYAWWELPRFMWTMPPLAGFLMIGVAWPLVLGVLRNLGVTKAPVKAAAPAPAPVPVREPTRPAGPPIVVGPVIPKPPPPVDTREYGGEFYPVVKVTHKE